MRLLLISLCSQFKRQLRLIVGGVALPLVKINLRASGIIAASINAVLERNKVPA
jgi:hypothetical protein